MKSANRFLRTLFFAPFILICSAESIPEKYYHSIPHHTNDTPTKTDPEWRLSDGDLRAQILKELSLGNELIGLSEWEGPMISKGAILREGRKVGATLVIFAAKYLGSENGGTFTSETLGRRSFSGFSIPIVISRSDQKALYFRHGPRVGLGISNKVITSDTRSRLGTNLGFQVADVVSGSPAFRADILPDDILMSINGMSVYDLQSMTDALQSSYGKEVKIVLDRSGIKLEKWIKFSADGTW